MENFDSGLQVLIWIIGVLSILVTALIGWQIFALIDIRRIKSEMQKQREAMAIEEHRHSLLSLLAASDVYYSLIFAGKQPEHQIISKYIQNRLFALGHASRLRDFDTCNIIVTSLLESITSNTAVSKASKKALLSALHNSVNTEKIDRFYELTPKISMLKIISTS